MKTSVPVAAAVFFLLVSLSKAQIPLSRRENCGALLSSVIAVCSQPILSRPDWCCNELSKWNEARCWCESNAFDALDTVASNGYAYSFRDGFCAEMFQRPARGLITQDYETCEPFESVDDSDATEQCTGGDPAALRMARFASLDQLRDDRVADATDLPAWFQRMDSLFTEEASIEIVGLFLGQGRFEVKQYFMTRQEAYGFEPLTAEFTGDHFWRSPNMVSYTGGATTASGYHNKREFVTFETCTARIAAVYTVEDNYQTRYSQFWNAADTRLMQPYDQTATSWCAKVAERCTGVAFPFNDMADCQSFYTSLASEGRITCNKFEQAYVPQYAMHGDTIACRSFYLDLAVVDAGGACPAVAREANQPRCGETQCPGNSWIDPFARDATQPQFPGTATVTCGETSCAEDWPSEAQIMSIPEGERPTISTTPTAPVNEPVAAPMPEPAQPAVLPAAPAPAPLAVPDNPEEAAAEDAQIDTVFENENLPPSGPPAQPEMGFVSQPLNA